MASFGKYPDCLRIRIHDTGQQRTAAGAKRTRDRHQLPNLATRSLALNCARLSDDWLGRWGHPIVAVESFVEGQLFRSTAYKAAGWHVCSYGDSVAGVKGAKRPRFAI